MIDMETIRFMKMIEELSGLSENAIIPITECTEATYNDHIVYDEKEKNDEEKYRIPLEVDFIGSSHKIISYYEDFCESSEYSIGVDIDEYDHKSVNIFIDDIEIIIEDGTWYFA